MEIEHLYLSWFPSLQLPLAEDRILIGGDTYFLFSSQIQFSNEKSTTVHGKSKSRQVAALKCISECIERKAMYDFFHSDVFNALSTHINTIFKNSNGWAVHLDQKLSNQAAYREAIERHLLLKTFIKHGWNGFRRVKSSEIDGIKMYFLESLISTENFSAGLVLSQAKDFPGVTIGSTAGRKSEVLLNSFWEDAWLESVFKMKMLQRNGVQPATGWIEKEINSWVQESFAIEDLSMLTSVEAETETDPKVDFIELNLKDYLKAPLDIYASYASGEEIIPLFHWPSLQDERKQTVQEILRRHDIFHEPPQRMPVL